jgi:glycosyltransferase involved in cell wall biosynthesis
VSLVIPCLNEERHIGPCVESLLATDYPLDRLEILVVDGRSDDGTRAVVQRIAEREGDRVRLVDNPDRVTPAALNRGIAQSLGDMVMITGAHCEYPADYVRTLVEWQMRSGADVVGGRCESMPGDSSAMATAIAAALGHPFGVGNSWFRIGATEPRWVDTVPFGCYRRDVFERFGVFDEELVRNQDDEFNLRILRGGGRLLLVPQVCSRYYTRTALRQVARMFYQYGLYKPLVARKLGRVMTVRQLAPGALVASLLAALALAPFTVVGRIALLGLFAVYVVADVVASLGLRRRGIRATAELLLVFPTVHLSYGAGFLLGMLKLLRPRSGTASATTLPLSR